MPEKAGPGAGAESEDGALEASPAPTTLAPLTPPAATDSARRPLPMSAAKIMGFFRKRISRDSKTAPSSVSQCPGHPMARRTPPSLPVVYVPCPSPSRRERMTQRVIDHEIRMHTVETDTRLNLPPAIQVSADGEEDFYSSQRQLHQAVTAGDNVFTPPPNRTIGEGDSPPPYRTRSQSAMGSYERPHSKGRESRNTLALPRCHTHSNNNNHQPRNWNLDSLSTGLASRAAAGGANGHLREGSTGSDAPPPDYCQVMGGLEPRLDPVPDPQNNV